jgi:homoserine/homoserine lactone efflux protein
MDLPTWLLFLPAAIAISVSLGAGAVAAMSSGANYGLRRGYWTIWGLEAALLFQLVIVAVGLGALLAASEVAFSIIKWCGAIYLAYLGIRLWRQKPVESVEEKPTVAAESIMKLVVRGFLVNALNPKAVVFMLAVLPQFIDAKKPLVTQYTEIGSTMVIIDLVVMGGYAALGSRVLTMLRSAKNQLRINRLFGSVFLAAAALVAMARRAES